MDMHSIRRFHEVKHKLRMGVEHVLRRLTIGLKRNARQIGYYALVLVALCAIARAAEMYRAGNTSEEALILPAVETMDEPDAADAEPAFICPAEWDLLRGFSALPVWRDTLGMWETHTAVDYVCPDARVPSLCEGIVQTVGSSGVYGGFVEVEHDGMRMRYASITPAEEIEPGRMLEAGDTVGWMDASMPGEAEMGQHLHLELYMEDSAADFDYLARENSAAD